MTGISHLNLWRHDLRLLVAFDALMAERNVTMAAQRLSLGQPAVSHILSRLRDTFGDSLFVRTARGLEPTTRAQELHAKIQPLLLSIEAVFQESEDFNPEATARTFRLAMPDHFEITCVPSLIRRAKEVARAVSFATVQFDPVLVMDQIERDRIDIAINYFAEIPNWIKQSVLFEENYICGYNPKLVEAPSTREKYVDSIHVSVQMRDHYMNRVAEAAQAQGISRNVCFRTHSYVIAAFVAAKTGAIVTGPELKLRPIFAIAGLDSCEPPFELPSFPTSMIWHQRADGDPSLIWLRSIMTEVVRDLVLR